jgi:parvulin-like peptidyl-prolyl isomerase
MKRRNLFWQGLAGAAMLALMAGRTFAQAPAAAMQAAAVVNGEPISMADVKAILDTVPPPVIPATAEQKREMQHNVVEMLINDLVMRQFLRQHTAPASPAAIDKEIAELKIALDKKKSTLQAFLKESNQSEAQLRQDIAASLQWKAYIAARVNDAALKAYYESNKPFFDKITVRASHILVKVAPNAPEADKQGARTKLQAIRQEIMAGKLDFAEAAKRFSDCESKRDGGDLINPFRCKFDVPDAFARAAFSMRVGEISDIVQTDLGLHLIKVTDRSAGEPSNFDAIKTEVREVYSMELYQQVISEQRTAACIQINI